MTTPTTLLPFHIDSSLFSLSLRHGKQNSYITMRVNTNAVNTRHIPQTQMLLAQHLPSIFESRCFNDDQLPFSIEVLRTEIGHLFEHILLEYLCELKLEQGYSKAVYQGVTSWNWLRDPRGEFHIKITAGLKDATIFAIAMHQTIKLISIIMETIAYDPMLGIPLHTPALAEQRQQNTQTVN